MLWIGVTGGACTPVPSTPPEVATDSVGEGPRLSNPEWTILRMAAGHGSLVIEAEATSDDVLGLAKTLADPLKDDYTEVLVYVYARGAPEGTLPRRVEWRPETGYVELD